MDDPSASDPDIMDLFRDLFNSPSRLMHDIAFGYSTGVSHEVIAHSSAFAHMLAENIGQATCTSRDGVIHDRLQGEH